MRYLLGLSIITLLLSGCFNNTKTDDKKQGTTTDSIPDSTALSHDTVNQAFITDIVIRFIDAYNRQDNDSVNALIHTDIGITIIHRPGAMDWFDRVKKLDFQKSVPSYYPYRTAKHNYPILFEKIPVFDCGKEAWDKTGLFVDVLQETNILSPIAEQLAQFEDFEFEEDYEKYMDLAEHNSYRVVLTTETPLVFHVKEIDGKWYVTILDRAYGDCSA